MGDYPGREYTRASARGHSKNIVHDWQHFKEMNRSLSSVITPSRTALREKVVTQFTQSHRKPQATDGRTNTSIRYNPRSNLLWSYASSEATDSTSRFPASPERPLEPILHSVSPSHMWPQRTQNFSPSAASVAAAQSHTMGSKPPPRVPDVSSLSQPTQMSWNEDRSLYHSSARKAKMVDVDVQTPSSSARVVNETRVFKPLEPVPSPFHSSFYRRLSNLPQGNNDLLNVSEAPKAKSPLQQDRSRSVSPQRSVSPYSSRRGSSRHSPEVAPPSSSASAEQLRRRSIPSVPEIHHTAPADGGIANSSFPGVRAQDRSRSKSSSRSSSPTKKEVLPFVAEYDGEVLGPRLGMPEHLAVHYRRPSKAKLGRESPARSRSSSVSSIGGEAEGWEKDVKERVRKLYEIGEVNNPLYSTPGKRKQNTNPFVLNSSERWTNIHDGHFHDRPYEVESMLDFLSPIQEDRANDSQVFDEEDIPNETEKVEQPATQQALHPPSHTVPLAPVIPSEVSVQQPVPTAYKATPPSPPPRPSSSRSRGASQQSSAPPPAPPLPGGPTVAQETRQRQPPELPRHPHHSRKETRQHADPQPERQQSQPSGPTATPPPPPPPPPTRSLQAERHTQSQPPVPLSTAAPIAIANGSGSDMPSTRANAGDSRSRRPDADVDRGNRNSFREQRSSVASVGNAIMGGFRSRRVSIKLDSQSTPIFPGADAQTGQHPAVSTGTTRQPSGSSNSNSHSESPSVQSDGTERSELLTSIRSFSISKLRKVDDPGNQSSPSNGFHSSLSQMILATNRHFSVQSSAASTAFNSDDEDSVLDDGESAAAVGDSATIAEVNDAAVGDSTAIAEVNDAAVGDSTANAEVNDAAVGDSTAIAEVSDATVGDGSEVAGQPARTTKEYEDARSDNTALAEDDSVGTRQRESTVGCAETIPEAPVKASSDVSAGGCETEESNPSSSPAPQGEVGNLAECTTFGMESVVDSGSDEEISLANEEEVETDERGSPLKITKNPLFQALNENPNVSEDTPDMEIYSEATDATAFAHRMRTSGRPSQSHWKSQRLPSQAFLSPPLSTSLLSTVQQSEDISLTAPVEGGVMETYNGEQSNDSDNANRMLPDFGVEGYEMPPSPVPGSLESAGVAEIARVCDIPVRGSNGTEKLTKSGDNLTGIASGASTREPHASGDTDLAERAAAVLNEHPTPGCSDIPEMDHVDCSVNAATPIVDGMATVSSIEREDKVDATVADLARIDVDQQTVAGPVTDESALSPPTSDHPHQSPGGMDSLQSPRTSDDPPSSKQSPQDVPEEVGMDDVQPCTAEQVAEADEAAAVHEADDDDEDWGSEDETMQAPSILQMQIQSKLTQLKRRSKRASQGKAKGKKGGTLMDQIAASFQRGSTSVDKFLVEDDREVT